VVDDEPASVGARLVALLIDLVICGFLAKVAPMPLVWLTYHAVLWSWNITGGRRTPG